MKVSIAMGRSGISRVPCCSIPFGTSITTSMKQDRYSDLMAGRMAEQGRRFSSHQLITHPLATFLKMYVQRAGFLDAMPGLILSGLYAYYTFIKYAKFWEISKDKGSV